MEVIGALSSWSYIIRGLQFLDLIREGNIDLMKAVDKFKCQAAGSSPHMRRGGPGSVAESGRPAGKEWALARRDHCARIGVSPVRASNRRGSQASMLTKVTRLEKLGGFRLRVRFSAGSEGVHDFAAMVQEPGSALEPLRDEGYFARVFLEFGAPTWPNGFDIAPEWLRREMEAAGELTRAAAE
jgi:hypothetical protein